MRGRMQRQKLMWRKLLEALEWLVAWAVYGVTWALVVTPLWGIVGRSAVALLFMYVMWREGQVVCRRPLWRFVRTGRLPSGS